MNILLLYFQTNDVHWNAAFFVFVFFSFFYKILLLNILLLTHRWVWVCKKRKPRHKKKTIYRNVKSFSLKFSFHFINKSLVCKVWLNCGGIINIIWKFNQKIACQAAVLKKCCTIINLFFFFNKMTTYFS